MILLVAEQAMLDHWRLEDYCLGYELRSEQAYHRDGLAAS